MTGPDIAFLVGAVALLSYFAGLLSRALAPPPPPPPQVPRRDYDLEELTAAVQRGVGLLDALANRCSKCGKSLKPVGMTMTTCTGRWVEEMAYARSLTCRCNPEGSGAA